jgi:DNA-binding transcriptional ArsR family regulator
MWSNCWIGLSSRLPLADTSIPVTIGKAPATSDDLSRILGESAADVMGLYLSVIDREDRLESGTGEWLTTFRGEPGERKTTARESVLRALRMASDATNYRILSSLKDGVGTPIEDLVRASGLGRLALAERLGDLVSAGLAAKLPEANQIVGVPAGSAMVRLVEAAATQAATSLAQGD